MVVPEHVRDFLLSEYGRYLPVFAFARKRHWPHRYLITDTHAYVQCVSPKKYYGARKTVLEESPSIILVDYDIVSHSSTNLVWNGRPPVRLYLCSHLSFEHQVVFTTCSGAVSEGAL